MSIELFLREKDLDVALRILLQLSWRHRAEIERLLHPNHHEELMKLLHDIRARIEHIEKNRNNHSQADSKFYDDQHRLLFSCLRSGDGPFFQQLLKIVQADFPTTIDAWCFWAIEDRDHFFERLEWLCSAKTSGDESMIAQYILKNIIPNLQLDPQFLEKNPQKLQVHERQINIKNIPDIYRYIGEWVVEILNIILLAFQKRGSREVISRQVANAPPKTIPKELLPDEPLVPRIKTSTPGIHHRWKFLRYWRKPVSTKSSLNPDEQTITDYVIRMNVYCTKYDIDLRVSDDEFIVNGFGVIVISITVEEERKARIKDIMKELALD